MIRRFLILLALTGYAAGGDLRTWNLPGGRTLEARLSGIEDGKALLLPANGKTPMAVPTHDLRGTDRAARSNASR